MLRKGKRPMAQHPENAALASTTALQALQEISRPVGCGYTKSLPAAGGFCMEKRD